ncbi:MAG: response regulator, partial [Pseudobdellovibrionaceae bacterium]|nr:response regulator [Pseudobdellovibrionaceae bacterium]
SGLRVLVVDDSADNRFLIARLLTQNGAEVNIAGDGVEGFNEALSGSYDIILMDIQMPKMDGYQAKEVLDRRGYKQPIIALTAHAMTDERLKTKTAGFAGHLTKPIVSSELLNTVASIGKSMHQRPLGKTRSD